MDLLNCLREIALPDRDARGHLGVETFGRYTDVRGPMLAQRGVALLECLRNLTANEMFDEDGAKEKPAEEVVEY